MSEQICMSISIGGKLPKKLLDEFIEVLFGDVSELNEGPRDKKSFLAYLKTKQREELYLSGLSNFGECDDTKAYCENHKLSYIHRCEAKYDYEAQISYWIPGMDVIKSTIANQNGEAVIRHNDIRPLCNLMIDVIKQGPSALALYMDDKGIGKKLLERGLKNPEKLHEILKEEIEYLIHELPVLPPFKLI